jgi:hypothetical protein
MLPDPTPTLAPRRWPRGQKFTLSAAGLEAEQAYREVVNGARSSGRPALQAALSAWAEPLRLQAGDGILLTELSGQKKGLNELSRALEDAGIEPAEVKAAVDRLVLAGLAEALPLASQVA